MAKCIVCFEETHNPEAHWAFEGMDPVLASPANRIVVGAMWREAKRLGCEDVFLEVWRRKRASWLTWQTVTQRKWQRDTRNSNKARHHDSVSIRERYVRIGSAA